MNSARKPRLLARPRLRDRRASAKPRPTTAATAEPRIVAKIVSLTPSKRVGRISQTKEPSHSMGATPGPHAVEAARQAPLEPAPGRETGRARGWPNEKTTMV